MRPEVVRGRVRTGVTVAVAIALLAGGGALVALILATEPTATRETASKETAMPVAVTEVETGTYRPRIEAMGTVRPRREIALSPRVAGQVVERGAAFVPGRVVAEGELLLRLDPADYEHTLQQRRSELEQAQAELRIEQGEQRVAAEDYERLDEELPAEQRALVLRQPQLSSARARVASARAAVAQAELELGRTRIRAPFDAQVLSREVNVGSRVTPGDELARLVGAESYWVEATVPVAKLPWIRIPGPEAEQGARVRIRDRGAWEAGMARTGRVDQLIGSLSDETRMARLLVAVADPLGREAAGRPRLLLDAYVACRIQGRPLEGVVRLDRAYVREGGTAWVMADGELAIRELDIRVRDAEHAYVAGGLSDGDRVVTSELATVREGVPLRLKGETP